MSNAFLLALNILKIAFRKKGNIIVFFVVPIMGLLFSMAAYATTGAAPLKIGVCDQDKSSMAGDLVKALSKEEKYIVTIVGAKEIENKLTAGKVDCVIVIPQGFADGIYNNRPKQLEVVSIKGEAATSWVKNYLNIYSRNLLDIAVASGWKQEIFKQIYDNFQQEKLSLKVNKVQDRTKSMGMTSQSIGFLIMFMMIGAINTAEMILKEKSNRTYYRICAATVNGRTYVLGNVLANLTLVVIQVFLVLFLMTKVFGIETYIPFQQLFLILVFFGLVAIGLGLMIVAFSTDSKQANTLQLIIVTPTCLLAGCFWPIEIMPKTAQRIADFLPQRWVLDTVQKLQAGDSFSQVLPSISIILAFALLFFLIAAYRFGRNDSLKTVI